ncbi:HAD-IA family hydrolase [Candidatus Woesearchaeota archaeon]|nr:HAD-IA family hydrolase [Candidatus Woesearchaeota archaeon]
MAITTIFFDIGEVLFADCDANVTRMISERFDVSEERVYHARRELWQKFGTGDIKEDEFWEGIYQKSGIKYGHGDIDWIKAEIIIEPFNSNIALLERLKEAGYFLGIISNHSKEWSQRIMATEGFGVHFDYVVFSCDDNVKCLKPNEGIYHAALKYCGETPESCLFVDNKQANVDAAVKLGMNAFVYNRREEQDLEVMLKQQGICFEATTF